VPPHTNKQRNQEQDRSACYDVLWELFEKSQEPAKYPENRAQDGGTAKYEPPSRGETFGGSDPADEIYRDPTGVQDQPAKCGGALRSVRRSSGRKLIARTKAASSRKRGSPFKNRSSAKRTAAAILPAGAWIKAINFG